MRNQRNVIAPEKRNENKWELEKERREISIWLIFYVEY